MRNGLYFVIHTYGVTMYKIMKADEDKVLWAAAGIAVGNWAVCVGRVATRELADRLVAGFPDRWVEEDAE